jgi:hypothetical protein
MTAIPFTTFEDADFGTRFRAHALALAAEYPAWDFDRLIGQALLSLLPQPSFARFEDERNAARRRALGLESAREER